LTPKGHEIDWPRFDEAFWNQHPPYEPKRHVLRQPLQRRPRRRPLEAHPRNEQFRRHTQVRRRFLHRLRPAKNYAPNDGDQRGYGWGYLAHEAKDDRIPATPTVERDGRRFKASAFASPAKAKPAALEWRVGRVGQRGWYELADHWRRDIDSGVGIDIPPEVFAAPDEYRVRARWRDDTGRCGHWSAPVVVK